MAVYSHLSTKYNFYLQLTVIKSHEPFFPLLCGPPPLAPKGGRRAPIAPPLDTSLVGSKDKQFKTWFTQIRRVGSKDEQYKTWFTQIWRLRSKDEQYKTWFTQIRRVGSKDEQCKTWFTQIRWVGSSNFERGALCKLGAPKLQGGPPITQQKGKNYFNTTDMFSL